MNFDAFFGGAILVGLLAACWERIKWVLNRALSTCIVTVKIDGETASAVQMLCWYSMRRSPFGDKRYGGCSTYVRPVDRTQCVAFEQVSEDAAVFWHGWRPLLMSSWNHNKNNSGEIYGCVLTFIRGMYNADTFISEAVNAYNSWKHNAGEERKRFAVKKLGGSGSKVMRLRKGWEPSVAVESNPGGGEIGGVMLDHVRIICWERKEVGPRLPANSPWADLALPEEALFVAEECRRWYKSKQWYGERGLPWRRGLLLYGAPGTGKSSFVRAVACELDLPVFSFDLATMTNSEMESGWQRALSEAPAIVLIEDIDAVFNKRENKLGENGGGLSFDCLLNCISGVGESAGVLVFVTTNNIAELDEAMGIPTPRGVSTRPGRIDRTLEFGVLDEACKQRIAERVLADCKYRIADVLASSEGDVGAQFQERCARVAETEYWKSTVNGRVHIFQSPVR